MASVDSISKTKFKKHKKRKRNADEEAERRAAKQSRPEPKKAEEAINSDIGHMSPTLLAEFIFQKLRYRYRNLNSQELEAKSPPSQIFLDTTSFGSERALENLPAFLKSFSAGADLTTSDSKPGSPHTIVIAASGLRAAEVTRSLREFQSKDSAVAKLFAKHIKLAESIEYVSRTRIGIGIGTPQRLVDLIEQGALQTNALKTIVLDVSALDQKRRSIFDMTELVEPLLKLLSMPSIELRLEDDQDKARVLVF